MSVLISAIRHGMLALAIVCGGAKQRTGAVIELSLAAALLENQNPQILCSPSSLLAVAGTPTVLHLHFYQALRDNAVLLTVWAS